MSIIGQTKNILIPPILNKDVDEKENFLPSHINLMNGRLSDAGNWIRRPGYAEKWDVGVGTSITALIPFGPFAVGSNGFIYKLGDSISRLEGFARLVGKSRPTWAQHTDSTVICNGGSTLVIENPTATTGKAERLAGAPSGVRFLDVLDTRLILSGHPNSNPSLDGPEFTWSDEGGVTGIDSINTNAVAGAGETLQFMKVNNRRFISLKIILLKYGLMLAVKRCLHDEIILT